MGSEKPKNITENGKQYQNKQKLKQIQKTNTNTRKGNNGNKKNE